MRGVVATSRGTGRGKTEEAGANGVVAEGKEEQRRLTGRPHASAAANEKAQRWADEAWLGRGERVCSRAENGPGRSL